MYEVKRDLCLEFRHWTYSLAPFTPNFALMHRATLGSCSHGHRCSSAMPKTQCARYSVNRWRKQSTAVSTSTTNVWSTNKVRVRFRCKVCFKMAKETVYPEKCSAHSPSFTLLHLRHSSFSNPSVALHTSQLILQPFRCFTYVTAHSPTLLSLLRHRIFTCVTWRAAHGLSSRTSSLYWKLMSQVVYHCRSIW